MKKKRLEKILELISNHCIDTQEALGEWLARSGMEVTQATISRDIKELGLIKTSDENGDFHYATPSNIAPPHAFGTIFPNSVRSVDYAGNMVVLKCGVGMAQAVCASLDGMNFPEIVGTLAGDDTVFILLRSEDGAEKLAKQLSI